MQASRRCSVREVDWNEVALEIIDKLDSLKSERSMVKIDRSNPDHLKNNLFNAINDIISQNKSLEE